MFGFCHAPASQLQSQSGAAEFCGLFGRFVQALQLAATALTSRSGTIVTWFPEYGCALLALGAPGGAGAEADDARPRPDDLALHLVGLDGWKFWPHSTPSGVQHTAQPDNSQALPCGAVASSEHADLISRVHTILAKGSQAAGGGGGTQQGGHKHSPASVHSVVLAALRGADGTGSGPAQSRGGFSDVCHRAGGGALRDTCWPLVKAVMQFLLESAGICTGDQQPDVLFRQALAHLDLWLLRRQLALLQPATATPVFQIAATQMLQAAAYKAAALADEGYDMIAFEAACKEARARIDALAGERALTGARRLELPNHGSAALLGTLASPTGVLPAATNPRVEDGSLEAARGRAARNLGPLPLLPRGASLTMIQAQMSRPEWAQQPGSNDVAAQLAIRSFERELFWRAAEGFDAKVNRLGSEEVASLEAAVDAYRSALQRYLQTTAAAAAMRVELRSRELLAVWVAYCLTHAAAGREHPMVLRYSCLANYADLRHLVLSDAAAVNAALSVAAYLQQHSKAGLEVFALRDGGAATQALALEFARGCPRLGAVLAAEQADAEARIQGHWREVQRKQVLAAELRAKLRKLQAEGERLAAELRQREQELEDARSEYRIWGYDASYKGAVSVAQSKRDSAKRLVDAKRQEQSSTKTQLAEAEKAPPPVIQPLPHNADLARQWLFFMHMPPAFRRLSRASFLAQQMLLPQPISQDVFQAVSTSFKTSLVQHYNSYRKDTTNRSYHNALRQHNDGADGAVMLKSLYAAPQARDVGPKSVDDCTSPQDGIWHPDSLVACMAWGGSGVAADSGQGFPPSFNPFAAVADAAVEDYFTERLPGEASSLQWAMQQSRTAAATPAERGNLPIARQDSRPSWLTKPAFLEFGTLRAYPLRQLRRLCAALHDRSLPLARIAVHTLIRQTLFQLGPLTDARQPGLLHRAGWDGEGDVLPTLAAELAELAEELDQTPREHDAVLLLGEVAAYLADWHKPCVKTARRFAAMTARAADELEPQLVAQSDRSEVVSEILARQCRARCMALLCYGAGPLDAGGEDVGAMLQLLVLINQGCVFQADPAKRSQLQALVVRVHNVMASRVTEVMEAAERSPALLTAVVGRILTDRAPPALAWRLTAPAASAFEAVGPDGRLYSVNVLDGTVLFDGWPPGRLPREVTGHPLYVRTFGGGWNFEVALGADGVMRALRPVRGRYYDFRISDGGGSGGGGGELTITEEERKGDRLLRLELLDVGEDGSCGGWGAQLPERLRRLHSHWLCRELQAIVLRPPNFQQHASDYVVRCASAAGTVQYDCRRVPPHLRERVHWTDLLFPALFAELPYHLVLQRGSAVQDTVLAKLEDPRFIHTYSDDSGQCVVLYELPRYGLEFALQSDGQLTSRNFNGYRLRKRQQLVSEAAAGGGVQYTLREFERYLVLERSPGGSTVVLGARRADELVLVPAGEVHCYEMHGRFGHLTAASDEARPQLAALYAATSSLLPEPASRETGVQTALRLMRGCWRNRPFSASELAQLRSAASLGGHLAPALRLLAHELEASACALSHLHEASTRQQSGTGPALDADAGACYVQEARRVLAPGGWGPNPRQLLTAGELSRAVGALPSAHSAPAWKRLGQYGAVPVTEPFPVPDTFVAETEDALCRLVVAPPAARRDGRTPPYPLEEEPAAPPGAAVGGWFARGKAAARGAGGATAAAAAVPVLRPPLEEAMHSELRDSWEAHHGLPSLEQLRVASLPRERLRELQATVQSYRGDAEAYLLRHLGTVPQSVGPHGAAFRLLRLAGTQPAAGLLDLMRAAWLPNELTQFNPFLAPEAAASLRQGVLVWLQLCVLEDRMARLVALEAAGDEYKIALIQELQVRRTWDPLRHPQWLVFEAEGGLQIRPQQHAVAAHLLAHPGAIAQLNMGEGKTRVILPMLLLELADGTRVVRLNLLSTLLDEAHAHFQAHLAASVLRRKVFTMPFHRDVKITAAAARAMRASLQHCKQEGGMLLVAPEHRLSLQLKCHELRAAGEERAADFRALEELAALPYLDLLDESDELLHHRHQLIYGCGTFVALQAVHERSGAVQALLRVASRLAVPPPAAGAGPAPAPLLPPAAVALEPPEGRSPGAYCGLRLLPGEALAAAAPGLTLRLARALLRDPPYELRWLTNHPLRDSILRCITDASEEAADILGPAARGGSAARRPAAAQLSDDQAASVLALRGLLAYGMLQHCLQKRHKVEYGVDRRGGARKRLAVPFRAAHTPSERSEFAQPDVAMALTTLSYYHDGLSRDEFLAALEVLLRMGLNAQRDFYNEWLRLSLAGIPAEDLPALDCVEKVDTSNGQQMDMLYGYFRHNMATVDFWLNHCVFPAETCQLPQRLAASAWHLADGGANGQVVGFSGTNDNQRLLPLQVHQARLEEPSLRATNGKMLHVILNTTLGFKTLPREDGGPPVWQVLLRAAVQQGAAALLDCGALLAGTTNRAAAEFLLPLLLDASRFQGVCFFDEQLRAWAVLDRSGRLLRRGASPIAERDTFAIFDEARCRGADLQLRLDTVGLLTLGPGACKDKVMQAAGRLRQLGRGQRLRFAATPDVTAKIAARSANQQRRQQQPLEPTARCVLRWVMANTVEATLRGVTQWAAHGLHFAATKGVPERVLQDEILDLDSLYGGSRAELPLDQVVRSRVRAAQHRCEGGEGGEGGGAGLAPAMRQLMEEIGARGVENGSGFVVLAGGGAAEDEECERELEEEEEEEEEQEKQVPRASPRPERDWAFTTALAAASPEALDPGAGVVSLPHAALQLQPCSLGGMAWSPQVYCTANFLYATSGVPAGAALNEYLRPVDALLLYPSGQVLLLSEREADRLLALVWPQHVGAGGGGSAGPRCSLRLLGSTNTAAAAAAAPLLVSLCYARLAFTDAAPRLEGPLAPAGDDGGRIGGRVAGDGTGVGASGGSRRGLGAAQLVSTQLFNGEATYGSEAQRRELRSLVWRRREEAEALVDMRGKQSLLPRSDLEKACEHVEGP
ncbi:hypothetical protein GPECTOR_19g282 [Gonium pectorale]|uniref:ubiquitinyl hydrolase 1 n=1 Tax=Gonium pectorale TaxID=33097 RepID=A0A150GJ37_GONPE|nr:hypothetical protein GPECTOR_19g282 [Gonium pectorale]|eukprot:KXZ49831.1 hypothetical protein GPECTOR_19g282 [Gonium pectorale]